MTNDEKEARKAISCSLCGNPPSVLVLPNQVKIECENLKCHDRTRIIVTGFPVEKVVAWWNSLNTIQENL